MRNIRLVLFAGLLISIFILSVKFLQPVSIQLTINGSVIEFEQQPTFYGLVDVIIVAGSAFTAGVCLVCLLSGFGEMNQDIVADSSKIVDLSRVLESAEDGDEGVVLRLVVEAGGSMFQSDVVKLSGFSRGKVSLVLDRLEARGLIERKRSGMTNLVLLTPK